VVYPDSPQVAADISSKKRKRLEVPEDEEDLQGGSDQREKADAALRDLQAYMQDVFEADDQYQPEYATSNNFLVTIGEIATLNGGAQYKVDNLLQKTIGLGAFSRIPLEDLLRLQKLCESSMKATESISIKVGESWEEGDVEEWLEKLGIADIGLKAARTSLRIMTGGREEKQLSSEETINSALNALKNVLDSAIVPIVEMRSTAAVFKLLSSQKKYISAVLNQCRRLLSLLKDLIARTELSETVIITLEYLVSQLIFVENAPIEKDSILGVQKFDTLRFVAMDALAQIFSSCEDQRQGIFNEILTSLEKLPVTRQSARQFKLLEGGSIQLVSALIMRLVQTSANKSEDGKDKRRRREVDIADDDLDADADAEADELADEEPYSHTAAPRMSAYDTEKRAELQHVTAIQELQEVVSPLLETATRDAYYVVNFIVNRAMKSTKTGDAPYRNLLDLFVEDFIACLASTDWPAAELLLRLLLFKMVQLAEGDKTGAPAKNMALDLLGDMGAAISQLNSHVRTTAAALESSDEDPEFVNKLVRLAEASLDGKVRVDELIAWSGPYRASLEYVDKRCAEENALQSAVGYRVADWACQIYTNYNLISDPDSEKERKTEQAFGRLAYRLRMMVLDKRWLSAESGFKAVDPSRARFAYALTILNSQFCKAFERVLMILLNSMSSDQATVRTKSLKSINQVLETDPTILDHGTTVMRLILRCAGDPSVQVRDSALGLIGKCISLRPNLEEEVIPAILLRVSDSGVGVRKRAIRLVKDIYLRNSSEDVRTAVADALLNRVMDPDQGVQELARQTVEDVWMAPFYLPVSVEDNSVQYRLSVSSHVKLMAKTLKRNAGVMTVLDKVLQSMLSPNAKLATANRRVCKTLVASMFDKIVDDSGVSEEGKDASDSLLLLTIFAKADPQLFTVDQVQLLQPYITNVTTEEEMSVFRSVVVIFRHVFPHLSKIHSEFLVDVRGTLMKIVPKATKSLLDDIVACLWIISEALDSYTHLARLLNSTLVNIRNMKDINFSDPKKTDFVRKFSKITIIIGSIGKHCNLDSQGDVFRPLFPKWKGSSVSKLMVDTLAPFTSPSQPLDIRRFSLDSIGMICQSWPKNFSSVNIYTAFKEAFAEQKPALEMMIMRSFKEFFAAEEKRSEPDSEAAVGASNETKATLGVMGGTDHDGVPFQMSDMFLQDFTRIALGSQDDHALLATEILTSICRQGLTHPGKCGAALVALETSQNSVIANMAFREHRAQHEKHETMMEKEHMRAIQSAFTYQHDVVKDIRGALKDSHAAKLYLMMEVLKISKPKSRQRFYKNLCSRVDFDLTKLDMKQDPPMQVQFSQFIIENLAFFEYPSIDDVISCISSMEDVVTGTGSSVAHAIETEVFRVVIEEASQLNGDGPAVDSKAVVKPERLRQLTAASMILSSLWEARTHLRRLYGLMNHSSGKHDKKSKPVSKDANKAPTKAQGMTGEKVWAEVSKIMLALSSQESMMEQCKAFVELLTVDKDFKIAAEGEDDATAMARFTTPSEDEEAQTPAGGSGRGRKRKNSSTPNGRKKRARSSSKSGSKKVKRGSSDSGEDVDDLI
jgi:cohesin loading factor subunit SCC2